MRYTWYRHAWQVYAQTSVIFKHLTQVSVVSSRSNLERKGEGKKRYRKKRRGGGAGVRQKCTNFPQSYESPQNSRRQNDINQVTYLRPTILKRHLTKFSSHGDLAARICAAVE
jgi:hypothetical protein